MAYKRVGFLADTHSNKPDGSDLPDQVLAAFKGVDLIVHLGDIGRKGILDRLAAVAPVLVPVGGDKGYVPAGSPDAPPVRVIEGHAGTVGLCFNLANPDKKITVAPDGALTYADGELPKLLQRRFKQPVDAVAFGGTHVQFENTYDGVLFLNPGSPNLPSDKQGDDDIGSVAVLDLTKKTPEVKLVRLKA